MCVLQVKKGKDVKLKSEDARKGEKVWSGMDAAAKKAYAKREKEREKEGPDAEVPEDDRLVIASTMEDHTFTSQPDADAVKKRLEVCGAMLCVHVCTCVVD